MPETDKGRTWGRQADRSPWAVRSGARASAHAARSLDRPRDGRPPGGEIDHTQARPQEGERGALRRVIAAEPARRSGLMSRRGRSASSTTGSGFSARGATGGASRRAALAPSAPGAAICRSPACPRSAAREGFIRRGSRRDRFRAPAASHAGPRRARVSISRPPQAQRATGRQAHLSEPSAECQTTRPRQPLHRGVHSAGAEPATPQGPPERSPAARALQTPPRRPCPRLPPQVIAIAGGKLL